MQIDFRQVIKGLDGKPVLDETQKPVTLGVACEMALMRNAPAGPGEPELTGDKKVHYMTLAQDIHVKGKVDVISDDIVLLKKLVGMFPFPTNLIAFRAHELLEPRPKEVKKKA